jgi:hypothetical protein
MQLCTHNSYDYSVDAITWQDVYMRLICFLFDEIQLHWLA